MAEEEWIDISELKKRKWEGQAAPEQKQAAPKDDSKERLKLLGNSMYDFFHNAGQGSLIGKKNEDEEKKPAKKAETVKDKVYDFFHDAGQRRMV